MNQGTFADRFCAKQDLSTEQYIEAALNASLYPAARALRPVLGLSSRYFAPDREFISSVGRIRQLRNFDSEAFAYIHDINNRGVLRNVFKLRVSVGRLHGIVRDTLHDGPSPKISP